MKLQKLIGKNIKFMRNLYSITQEDIAYRLDIGQSYYSLIENGTKPVSIEKLEKIAKILKVEPYILLKPNMQEEIRDKTFGKLGKL